MLLSVNKVKMWIDHLTEVQQNRQRGAVRAAETRKAKNISKLKQLNTVDVPSTSRKGVETMLTDSNTSPATESTDGTITCQSFPEQVESNCFCGVCGGQYQSVTEVVEDWIGCDS